MFSRVVPASLRCLDSLSLFLDRLAAFAERKRIDPAVLLGARLAPDMFPFLKQVQMACDVALDGCCRLTGVEGPRLEDTEKSVGDLRRRILRTQEFLRTLDARAFDGAEGRDIPMSWSAQKLLTGEQFLEQMLLPNLYFHVTASYTILRHNGVELGKADYLGKLPFRDRA